MRGVGPAVLRQLPCLSFVRRQKKKNGLVRLWDLLGAHPVQGRFFRLTGSLVVVGTWGGGSHEVG
jgi:hypothetical protein